MIIIKDLYKYYGDKIIINNFTHTFQKNNTTVITGPSGCGKTTLLRIIMKFETYDSGKITINENKNYTISALFQEPRLFPWLTTLENVDLAVNDKEESMLWLNKLDLQDTYNKYPDEMSGGMNQRVAIARAFAFESDILILDEPLKALDDILINKIIDLIIEEHGKRTILIVTHNLEIISKISDEVVNFILY